MNFFEIKEGLHIVGIEGGRITRQVVSYLEGKGQQVALYSVQEATMAMPLLVTRSNELPLALDAGYEEPALLELFQAAMRCGMHLMPIGDKAVWEDMVPLELPEMAANPVLSAERDWFVAEPDDTADGAAPAESTETNYYGITDINGTAVSIHVPDLSTPLADLNVAATVVPPPVVQAPPPKPVKKSSAKKQNRHSAVMALLCVLLISVMIVVCSVLILHDPNGEQPQPMSAAQNQPVAARPVRVWLNDCAYCRERYSLVLHELLPMLTSGSKVFFAKVLFNDGMLKIATSVNNGVTTCNKCKKLKVELNNIHSRWHASAPGLWVLDWKLARPGNETYKKIQVGAVLGCYTCKESLNEELVRHACPDDAATSAAFKHGADLDCTHCRDMLKKKLLVEHQCPDDNNRTLLSEGAKLGCEQCAKRKEHECPEPKSLEALQAGADIACPLCRKTLELLQKHVCPKDDHEKELEKGKELGCPECARRYAKMLDLKKIMTPKPKKRPVHEAPPQGDGASAAPQPDSSRAEELGRLQKIDGQWCPRNKEVQNNDESAVKVLKHHASKGCPHCRQNYAWWLKRNQSR